MTVHVAGAGLAGLAAAVTAARAGHRVILHEAAGRAGGRCRSFEDGAVGREIDNGTHVILGANSTAFTYLAAIGAVDSFTPATGESLHFADLSGGGDWTVRLDGRGPLPLLTAAGSAPRGTALLLRFAVSLALPGATVASAFAGSGAVYDRVVEPMTVAIMNRPATEVRLRSLARVLMAMVRGGRGAMRPFTAPSGLARAVVEPALAAIRALGGEVRFHDPLLAVEPAGETVGAAFRCGDSVLDQGDALVVALPPWALSVLPEGLAPSSFLTRAILCAHFATDAAAERLPEGSRLVGAAGGMAQWFAAAEGVLSVTVSAADAWMECDSEEIAAGLWRDACAALRLGDARLPPFRVIKERRATAEIAGGFGPRSAYANLFFAGGWTVREYPDTIEAALASGMRAANCLGAAG